MTSFVQNDCIYKFHKVIHYSYETQRDLLPQIISLATHFKAVPIAIEDAVSDTGETVVFDATKDWSGFTPAESITYLLDNFSSTFISDKLCKVNPGYQYPDSRHPLNYTLSSNIEYSIIDYAVSNSIFTFFLPLGCVPFTSDHAVHERIVQTFSSSNNSGMPITVYGYDNTVPIFGGDTYEAETNCVREHNMGQVASHLPNVGFKDGEEAKAELPFVPKDREEVKYDPSKIYVSITVGDGDNFWHLKYSHYNLMDQRSQKCEAEPAKCFPMSWTVSPEAARDGVMPDVINNLFERMRNSGGDDRIVLPPSGSLYSYPGMMPSSGQDEYIKLMDSDLTNFGTRVSVHWEWFYDWVHTFHTYFPKWSDHTGGEPRGFILTNVPYLFPMGLFASPKTDFKVIGDSMYLFRPNEWRYGSMKGSLSSSEMADKINNFDAGYISPIYTTRDGSLDVVNMSWDMVGMLNDNVQVVDVETLLDLAVQKQRLKREGGELIEHA